MQQIWNIVGNLRKPSFQALILIALVSRYKARPRPRGPGSSRCPRRCPRPGSPAPGSGGAPSPGRRSCSPRSPPSPRRRSPARTATCTSAPAASSHSNHSSRSQHPFSHVDVEEDHVVSFESKWGSKEDKSIEWVRWFKMHNKRIYIWTSIQSVR